MTDRETSVSIGKLSAQLETLTQTMTTTVAQFSAQGQGIARIETQIEVFEERVVELRKSLYGSEGTSGLTGKVGSMETTLKEIQKDISEVKSVTEDFKKNIYKALTVVVTSGLLSGGAGMKLLQIFGP